MLENIAALPPAWQTGFAGLIGLLVGSFLNVVIYRYPIRLKYQWSAQSHEWIHEEPYPEPQPHSIISPPSHCGSCQAPVRAWQNIPVISFFLLRGKCANCKTSISWRYPLVELLTAILTAAVIYRFGFTLAGGFGVLLTWALVTLSFIDFDHQLLPDDIVLPMLWLGLAISLWTIFAAPRSAIIGALAGYLSLWTVFHIFKLATGKEGMGHGDFKLLALFGAWFGWQTLPQILLISTILGSVVGITLIALRRSRAGQTIPFGPYLAIAGWCAMLFGEQINRSYLKFAGL